MLAHVVTYEHRDMIGRIVVEIDSVYLDEGRAAERRKRINSDPAQYPGMVADTQEFPIRDFALTVRATPPTKPGPNAKLTADQAIEIREGYAAGATLRELASSYGISFQSVSDVINGRTWRI